MYPRFANRTPLRRRRQPVLTNPSQLTPRCLCRSPPTRSVNCCSTAWMRMTYSKSYRHVLNAYRPQQRSHSFNPGGSFSWHVSVCLRTGQMKAGLLRSKKRLPLYFWSLQDKHSLNAMMIIPITEHFWILRFFFTWSRLVSAGRHFSPSKSPPQILFTTLSGYLIKPESSFIGGHWNRNRIAAHCVRVCVCIPEAHICVRPVTLLPAVSLIFSPVSTPEWTFTLELTFWDRFSTNTAQQLEGFSWRSLW